MIIDAIRGLLASSLIARSLRQMEENDQVVRQLEDKLASIPVIDGFERGASWALPVGDHVLLTKDGFRVGVATGLAGYVMNYKNLAMHLRTKADPDEFREHVHTKLIEYLESGCELPVVYSGKPA